MSKLRDYRVERGIMAKAAAQHIGVSYQTYHKYEDNPGLMRIEDALKLCEFFRCDIDDIFLLSNMS